MKWAVAVPVASLELIHVDHVVVDGGLEGDRLLFRVREQWGRDGLLDADAIADASWDTQHRQGGAWTFELDVRPRHPWCSSEPSPGNMR